jgi:hypothetical protein
MPNRTIQFTGQAYSSDPVASPVTITAILDGNTIFNGTVTTLQDPGMPWPPATEYVLFQVETDQLPTSFSGSLPMTCSVSGGGVNWCLINTNYYTGNVVQDANAGTVGNFDECYYGTPTNSEGTSDCRSNVYIDGVQQVPAICPTSTGVWLWGVYDGQTIAHNLNVAIGQVGNVIGG